MKDIPKAVDSTVNEPFQTEFRTYQSKETLLMSVNSKNLKASIQILCYFLAINKP
jgi:hypothetical protein